MNRRQVEALQANGVRVEQFSEPCGHCGRPSIYDRRTDRYTHIDGSDNMTCWVAISSGQPPMERIVSQRDSRAKRRVSAVA